MRTIPRHPEVAPRQCGTTELEGTRLRALVRESKKRATTNLEVELIRVDAAAPHEIIGGPSGSVHITFADEECASRPDREAIVPIDRGDPLPAGARTKLDRDELPPIDDGDPLPAGSRTRIDRDAIEPLPRPPERLTDAVYPIHHRRVSPALLLGLALSVAAYVGLWLIP